MAKIETADNTPSSAQAEQDEAAKAERRHEYAEELRNAAGPAEAEKIRRKWRADLGSDEQIGDFVMRLATGELVRVERPSTSHNGSRVIEVYEDPQ